MVSGTPRHRGITLATTNCGEQTLPERKRELEMKGEGSRCLRESQASVESSSPARSATALECFLIATVKRISHMAFTAASERPSTFTSATILHPDTSVPRGGTPTLSRSPMTNWI